MRLARPRTAAQVLDALAARDLLELVEDVCRVHGVELQEVCDRRRSRRVSSARQEIWWRLRHHPEQRFAFTEIARLFARDHATVMHGVGAHERRRSGINPPR